MVIPPGRPWSGWIYLAAVCTAQTWKEQLFSGGEDMARKEEKPDMLQKLKEDIRQDTEKLQKIMVY